MNTYNQYQKYYPMAMGEQNTAPVFQNTSAQQQNMQGLMAQNQKLGSQSLLPADMQYNPKEMANALRNMGETINAYSPWQQTNMSEQYGTDPYSEQSRMLAMQERGF
jgi:hypothetical protein